MHRYIIHLPWTSTVLLELTIESLLQSYNNIIIYKSITTSPLLRGYPQSGSDISLLGGLVILVLFRTDGEGAIATVVSRALGICVLTR